MTTVILYIIELHVERERGVGVQHTIHHPTTTAPILHRHRRKGLMPWLVPEISKDRHWYGERGPLDREGSS